ncbi:MAG: carbohydrate kinase family protein [Methanocellales archaeon]|nr:carbohydrate kinase family protein [Methanocellales archaeon]
MQKILVVGHVALDYIFSIPGFPDVNSSTYVIEYERFYGGGAANIAATIVSLGGKCELTAPVGMDFSHSGYEAHLENLGVELDHLVKFEGEKMARCYIFNDENQNQITYFYWGASDRFPELEVPKAKIVHIATANPVFNVKMAHMAEIVSFDPGQDLVRYSAQELQSILRETDILFANRHEIQRLCKIITKSLADIRDEVGTVVVTYGAEGSRIYANERIEIPSVQVSSVDPTGAGDGYRAGFLIGFVKGYDLDVCGKIGATVASFVVEKRGTQTNLPDWSQMKERYERFFHETI